MKVESESQGKLTWYLARLLCMKYEAELSDIEDDTDLEWLNALITSNKKNEHLSGNTAYYVNIHRYLYGTHEWTWGGPPNANRSFIPNFDTILPLDYCEPKLCAIILHATGSVAGFITLQHTHFGGKNPYARQVRAICKKRLPLLSTAAFLSHKTTFFYNFNSHTSNYHILMIVALLILCLLILVLLSFCIVRSFYARKLVCQSQRFAAQSETSTSGHETVEQRQATSTSYGPNLPPRPLSEYNEGEIELTTSPIQNQTDGLNSQRSQKVHAIESVLAIEYTQLRDHKAQGTFDSAHKMCEQQSLSKDILVHSVDNSDDHYVQKFK